MIQPGKVYATEADAADVVRDFEVEDNLQLNANSSAALMSLDKDGDGQVDQGELHAHLTEHEVVKSEKNLLTKAVKLLVVVLLVFSMLICGALYMIVDLSKVVNIYVVI